MKHYLSPSKVSGSAPRHTDIKIIITGVRESRLATEGMKSKRCSPLLLICLSVDVWAAARDVRQQKPEGLVEDVKIRMVHTHREARGDDVRPVAGRARENRLADT